MTSPRSARGTKWKFSLRSGLLNEKLNDRTLINLKTPQPFQEKIDSVSLKLAEFCKKKL